MRIIDSYSKYLCSISELSRDKDRDRIECIIAQKAVLIIVYNNQRHVPDSSSYNPSQPMDKFTHKIKGFAKLTGVDQLSSGWITIV